jgi:hypothetical protein
MPQATAQPAARAATTPPPCAAVPEPSPIAAPPPGPVRKRRGNPNLNLSPRCGARTRAGCPCRAPAIRGKLRCRMHGGRSTGPRTAEGMARLRAARTIHGRYSPERRAYARRILSWTRRGPVLRAAMDYLDRLPPDLVARFHQNPWELQMPAYTAGGISAAQDRAMQRAEKEALAPWRQAIAIARSAGRRTTVAPAEAAPRAAPPAAEPFAPARDAATTHLPDTKRSEQGTAAAKARAPESVRPAAPHPTNPALCVTAEALAPEPPRSAACPADSVARPSGAKPYAPEGAGRSSAPSGPGGLRQLLLAGMAAPDLRHAAPAFSAWRQRR